MRILTALLLFSLTLSLGCSSNNRRATPRSDGGVHTDSSTPPPRDSGAIALMDTGAPRDSSLPPPRDSGTGTCALDILPAFSGTACSASTTSCTDACTDGTCISNCLDADSNPDCAGCANQNILSCLNANGCQAQWNCYAQCFTDQGCDVAGAPTDCVSTRCGAPQDAYDTCTDGVTTGDCGTTWTTCLP